MTNSRLDSTTNHLQLESLMWPVASLFLPTPAPPPSEVVDLSTCATGTLPAQVIGTALEPMAVFMLAPGWPDARFQARCSELHDPSLCDTATYVYPSREQVEAHHDLERTNLRYSILLGPGRPLEGHIEGFRDGGEVFDIVHDLQTGEMDLRPEIDRQRDRLLRRVFTGAL